MICTVYSPNLVFDGIIKVLKKVFPDKAHIAIKSEGNSFVFDIKIRKWLFSSPEKMIINYRQRSKPTGFISGVDTNPLTADLKELYTFVDSLPATDEEGKDFLLQKISTINSEFTVEIMHGEVKELLALITMFAEEFDALLFVQPGNIISKTTLPHFLDKDLNFLMDSEGTCDLHQPLNESLSVANV